ncbi:MAG: 2,3-bisphosphoglycerate-independent phosphoglycerate mutase [Planctomycetota bacterium]
MTRRPLLLVVLDGWGHRVERESNAVLANAPYFHELASRHPRSLLTACGREVGLPIGVMGNSEVGHTNLGAGRVVYQDVSRIDKAIDDGEFQRNPAFAAACNAARTNGKALHLVGLISDGMVHASDHHLRTLLKVVAQHGVPRERVFVHLFTDGRDTPPNSGVGHVARVVEACEEAGVGRVASIIGRYFAMDRDKRWDRVKRAWDLLVHGVGTRATDPVAAMRAAYAAGVSDEFVEPLVFGEPTEGRFADGDAVISFNYRADRMRQLCEALGTPGFDGFERGRVPALTLVTMTRYREDFAFQVAFAPVDLNGIFPELVAAAGLRQERVAETEKYAHVTYFFSGGQEQPYSGETRMLVPSQRVATYDLAPEMSAEGITTHLLASLERNETDVYVVNFANADMVGHTGIYEAAARAVAKIDSCLQRIVPAALARGATVGITADHGNSEQLWDEVHQQPHTAHTLNPVPFLLVDEAHRGAKLREFGILADVAPTLLEVLGLQKHARMDGRSLLS